MVDKATRYVRSDRPSVIDPSEQYKRRRFKRFLWLVALFVGLPTFLGSLYYGFFASEYYISESKFVIHTNDVGAASTIDTLLPSTFGSFSARELYIAQEYITSLDALNRLNQEFNFKSFYQVESLDPLSRLPKSATREETFEYYQELLEVIVDSRSGVATLLFRAPIPEMAQHFSSALLRYAEEVVNELSARAQEDKIAFATKEVEIAESNLLRTRLAVQHLQRKLDDFNPLESASGIATIRLELESELVRARTDLEANKPLLQPNAHQLVVIRNRIASLERQIVSENARLVAENDSALNITASEFEALAFEKEFAEQRYTTALQFLEVSRIEALQQGRYLSVLSTPSLPEEALYPRRIFGVFTVFAGAFFIFSVGGITLAVIREHAKV